MESRERLKLYMPGRFIATLVLLAMLGASFAIWRDRRLTPVEIAAPQSVIESNGTSAAANAPVREWNFARPNRVPDDAPEPRFADFAPRRGITFNYHRGETGEYWLPETMGGGCAWLDYDNDGWYDLYFAQGCRLPTAGNSEHTDVLFRNMQRETWSAVPQWAGPSDAGYSMGAAVGDIDNDGYDDLYITNFGPHAFYRNNGDGTYSDATAATNLGCPLWGTSAAFGDLDRDGDLDLVVGNYVEHDPSIRCQDPSTRKRKYCGPDYYTGQIVLLYENQGAGAFADVSQSAGVARANTKALGVVIADLLDNDGWPEIFVANDQLPNFLFRNLAAGRGSKSAATEVGHGKMLRFEEIAYEIGAAVNRDGQHEANMGIACGDFDGNGWLDLYVTHYYMEQDTLWRNLGDGNFEDCSRRVGIASATLAQLSWGVNPLDFDNDSWLDIFVTSGHINDNESTVPYAMQPQLFRNLGRADSEMQFIDVSWRAGTYFSNRYVGRSSAVADFDRDGRVDVAVGHHHAPAALLHNELQNAGHALGLELVGAHSARSPIGARVYIDVPTDSGKPRRIVREVVGGGSYLSCDSQQILVGVGRYSGPCNVTVRWPSGKERIAGGLSPGRYWLLREDQPPRVSFDFAPSLASGP